MATTHLLQWPDDYITEINGLMKDEFAGVSTTLNNNSWETISQVAKAGIGDQYWDIGDCKEIILNGSIGSAFTASNLVIYVFILHFNYPVDKEEDNNIIFGGFRSTVEGDDIALVDTQYSTTTNRVGTYFNITHSNSTSYRCWFDCAFRSDILGAALTTKGQGLLEAIESPRADTLMAALSGNDNIRNVLKVWNRTNTSTQYLFDAGISLLGQYELTGSSSVTADQKHFTQMTYYANGNSKIRYKYNSLSNACYWWTMSDFTTTGPYARAVKSDGSLASSIIQRRSIGLAPIFKV